MKEDKDELLKRFFSTANQTVIADEGFSDRVMEAIEPAAEENLQDLDSGMLDSGHRHPDIHRPDIKHPRVCHTRLLELHKMDDRHHAAV